jgi:HEPN domain-containing protein
VSYDDDAYVRAMQNSIINDLFTRTADENYITARWCADNGMRTDFFWLGVHALEKYMKAVLLANGEAADKQGHKIVEIHDEISTFAGDLLPADLEKPADLNIPHWRKQTLRSFLEHLYDNGNADNRYLIFGYAQHFEDVHKLDQAVFAYRRLICALDDRVIPDRVPNAPTFTHRNQLKGNPRHFRSIGSSLPLDRLIRSKEESPLRHTALNLNFSFAPDDYPHTSMAATSASHNPVLFRRIFEPLKSTDIKTAEHGMKIATWTLKNIKLPLDVKRDIEKAMVAARKSHPSLP